MSNPTYTLENDFLKIKIKAAGAELCSLYNKQTDLEYLWQGDNPWPKHAPVLFPIVGQLKNNVFYYDKKSYSMERHGFARNHTFKAEVNNPEKIIFTLRENKDTLLMYPFHFLLSVNYQLLKSCLTVIYQVKNTDSKNLFFSIGAHPAFKVPLLEKEKYEDYYLTFEKEESIERHFLQKGLLDGGTKEIELNQGKLNLNKNLFYDDAIVIKNMKSEIISIKSNTSKHGLHFIFKGYPFFGIWAAKDADFVCLEPWHGITDNINHHNQIEDKEGIIALSPKNKFTCSYQMEPF